MKDNKPNIIHANQGFTLIEVLMYIALFALIIGAVVGLGILAISQREKDEVVSTTNYQGEIAMEYITQNIRGATSITTPTLGNNATSLSLVMPTSLVNPTTFTSYNDGTTTHIQVSQGSPAVTSYLTNSHVVLSALSFSNVGLSGTKGSIQISFTLTYLTSSLLEEFNYQKTFYGAATIP